MAFGRAPGLWSLEERSECSVIEFDLSANERFEVEVVPAGNEAPDAPHGWGTSPNAACFRNLIGPNVRNQVSDGVEGIHGTHISNTMLPNARGSCCFSSASEDDTVLPMNDSLRTPRGRPRLPIAVSTATVGRYVPEWKAAARSIRAVRMRALSCLYVANKYHGWSDTKIANELGCSRQNVRHMIFRDHSFRIDFAQLLKDICGVTIEYIYEGNDALMPSDLMTKIGEFAEKAESDLKVEAAKSASKNYIDDLPIVG